MRGFMGAPVSEFGHHVKQPFRIQGFWFEFSTVQQFIGMAEQNKIAAVPCSAFLDPCSNRICRIVHQIQDKRQHRLSVFRIYSDQISQSLFLKQFNCKRNWFPVKRRFFRAENDKFISKQNIAGNVRVNLSPCHQFAV